MARPICFRLLRQEAWRAFARALLNAGNNMAANMAMMAMTTNNSIRVNNLRCICLYLLVGVLIEQYVRNPKELSWAIFTRCME